MGQVLAFKRPDTEYPLADVESPEADIRCLRDVSYRNYNPSAIETGERFRRIFEGPVHTRIHHAFEKSFSTKFHLERRRSHMNLVQLLLGQRLAKSIPDAEAFIANILDVRIYRSKGHKRYFILERVPKKDAYRLHYFSH